MTFVYVLILMIVSWVCDLIELLALQSKFEEDKKRIQQIRAARKFKPY